MNTYTSGRTIKLSRYNLEQTRVMDSIGVWTAIENETMRECDIYLY